MNMLKMSLKLTVLCASMSVLLGCQNTQPQIKPKTIVSPQPFDLTILHINDHHSHLDAETTKLKFDIGQGPEEFTVDRGGISRVVAMMKQLDQPEKNIIKIHAGDAITGDFYYTLTDGVADAAAMNEICFDTFVLGNHEFDAKDAGLKYFLDALVKQQGTCKQPTQVLSANVVFGPSSPLYQTKNVQKATVIEKDGQKIGIVGLTIAGKTKNASQPNADTIFLDEIQTAQQEINLLKSQGINKIILQTHVGYELDQKLAQQLTDVDVIVGGDSHTLLGPKQLENIGLKPEGAYPTQLTNKSGDPVCVAQAWQYSYVLGELNVKFDPAGRVIQCGGTPHILIGDDFKRVKDPKNLIQANELQHIKQQIKVQELPLDIISPDVHMQTALQSYTSKKQAFTTHIVGYATEDFCSKSQPTNQITGSCLTRGGDVQQLMAEAVYLEGLKQFNADFSIQNAGGVRTEILKGPVTVDTVYRLLPFKNKLVRLNMTGAEVQATLEDVVDALAANNKGSYPYSGGMRWHVDKTQPKGQRITSLEVLNKQGKYQPILLQKTYQVATIDFLARGSESYTRFKDITGARRQDFNIDYADIFLKYVDNLPLKQGQKEISRLPVSKYSTQKYTE